MLYLQKVYLEQGVSTPFSVLKTGLWNLKTGSIFKMREPVSLKEISHHFSWRTFHRNIIAEMVLIPAYLETLWYSGSDTSDLILFAAERSPCSANPTPALSDLQSPQLVCLQTQKVCTPFQKKMTVFNTY